MALVRTATARPTASACLEPPKLIVREIVAPTRSTSSSSDRLFVLHYTMNATLRNRISQPSVVSARCMLCCHACCCSFRTTADRTLLLWRGWALLLYSPTVLYQRAKIPLPCVPVVRCLLTTVLDVWEQTKRSFGQDGWVAVASSTALCVPRRLAALQNLVVPSRTDIVLIRTSPRNASHYIFLVHQVAVIQEDTRRQRIPFGRAMGQHGCHHEWPLPRRRHREVQH